MQELIAAAAAQIEGCQGCHPLDDQHFAVVFDEHTYVLVTPIDAQERLSLEMPIGQVPPAHFAKVAKTLLSFNALNESEACLRFAVLPDDGGESVTAALLADAHSRQVEALELATMLAELAAQGQAWRRYLEEISLYSANAGEPHAAMMDYTRRA